MCTSAQLHSLPSSRRHLGLFLWTALCVFISERASLSSETCCFRSLRGRTFLLRIPSVGSAHAGSVSRSLLFTAVRTTRRLATTPPSIPRADVWAVSKFCCHCVPVAIPDRVSPKRLTLAATFHAPLLSWAETLASPLWLAVLSSFRSPRAFRREAFFPAVGSRHSFQASSALS